MPYVRCCRTSPCHMPERCIAACGQTHAASRCVWCSGCLTRCLRYALLLMQLRRYSRSGVPRLLAQGTEGEEAVGAQRAVVCGEQGAWLKCPLCAEHGERTRHVSPTCPSVTLTPPFDPFPPFPVLPSRVYIQDDRRLCTRNPKSQKGKDSATPTTRPCPPGTAAEIRLTHRPQAR